MVFLDIPDWAEAMKACVGALAVGGLLVFSITHPCFERLGSSWREHEIAERYGFNFHRPFSAYFNQLARLGCHLREVAEPALDPEIAAAAGPGARPAFTCRIFSWSPRSAARSICGIHDTPFVVMPRTRAMARSRTAAGNAARTLARRVSVPTE
jgi:hypothetical protein